MDAYAKLKYYINMIVGGMPYSYRTFSGMSVSSIEIAKTISYGPSTEYGKADVMGDGATVLIPNIVIIGHCRISKSWGLRAAQPNLEIFAFNISSSYDVNSKATKMIAATFSSGAEHAQDNVLAGGHLDEVRSQIIGLGGVEGFVPISSDPESNLHPETIAFASKALLSNKARCSIDIGPRSMLFPSGRRVKRSESMFLSDSEHRCNGNWNIEALSYKNLTSAVSKISDAMRLAGQDPSPFALAFALGEKP